jgi:polyhydroxyalkanoate synthase
MKAAKTTSGTRKRAGATAGKAAAKAGPAKPAAAKPASSKAISAKPVAAKPSASKNSAPKTATQKATGAQATATSAATTKGSTRRRADAVAVVASPRSKAALKPAPARSSATTSSSARISPDRQAAKAQAKSKTTSPVVAAIPKAPSPANRKAASPRTRAAEPTPVIAAPEPIAVRPLHAPAPVPPQAPPAPPPKAPQAEPVKDAAGGPIPAMPDLEALAANSARLIEEMGRATAAALKPVEEGRAKPGVSDEVSDMVKTLGQVVEHWAMDPQRVVMSQTTLTRGFMDLWTTTMRRLNGEDAPPVAAPEPSDKRFRDPDWTANPVFDFIKQAYLLTSRWAEHLVQEADGVDAHTKHKAEFYVRQLASALAPTNFVATNPELLRTTFKQNGENLVRGMKMLAEDIEAGKGTLKLRQSSDGSFAVGQNMATTPGKVIYRNDLIELIQYEPATEKVYKRPLLIVPPWINKFYILDLNAEKSFIRWAVSQGLTVFVISWVNPDERQAKKSFEDYMREGIFAALDAVKDATGEENVTAIGYCVGGTLLSVTLAYMAAIGDDRIESATLFTTQVDFTHAGDLAVFVDENQIKSLEDRMYARGYLEGSSMASAFNMLRPNDLIWPYVVNVYLKGESPFPFDLLYWNSDSTRMPAANHSFYLRNCYLTNRLAKGEMEIAGEKLDLGKVSIPIYNLAAREDHIAPAKSVFKGSKCFGGPVTYVLAGSGHIAGVVNPATKPKYQYWTGGKVEGTLDQWIAHATEHPGTWWPHWMEWIRAQAPALVKAREPGSGKVKPLCDAPGTYVKVRA